MTVKCIDNKTYSDDPDRPLTIGREYKVIEEHGSFYTVINDDGESQMYSKSRFELIEEELIITILGDWSRLTKGKEYKVMGTKDNSRGELLYKINDDGNEPTYIHYDYTKFKEEAIKPIVISLIDAPFYLTKGKEYEVLKESATQYKILSDIGNIGWPYKENFKLKNMKKIIGYKAPYDINPEIIEGAMYVREESTNKNYYYVKGYAGMGVKYYLNKQIVETWEPIYEEEKILEMDVAGVHLSINKGGLIDFKKEDVKGRTNIDGIEAILNECKNRINVSVAHIHSYVVKPIISSVRVGCEKDGVTISLEELQSIINHYKEFYKK